MLRNSLAFFRQGDEPFLLRVLIGSLFAAFGTRLRLNFRGSDFVMTALTPDELGEAGETLFQSLCAQARLVCNKSNRDRTGWDFRVEFPMEARDGAILDQRVPRVCQIQLKSTAGESGMRVPVRLSSVERLAKDAAPSAIIVLRMRSDGTPQMGFAIPMIDKELGRVLHRLRKAQADDRLDINHMTISFDYRKGIRFKPTPEGLRDALAAIAPVDVAAYAEKKRRQLETIGYDEGSGIEADVLFWAETKDQLVKVLSGLAPMKPLDMHAYDRRFGIRVPYAGSLLDGVEEFNIQLPATGPVEIVIRNGPLRPAAIFACESFAPPPIEGTPTLVIKHPMLTVLFRETGLEFETVGNVTGGTRRLEEWVLLLRGLAYLASGTATIDIAIRETKATGMKAGGALNGPYVSELPVLLEFVERWERALQLAGVVAIGEFAMDDIWSAEDARMTLDMLFNPHPLARLEFDSDGFGPLADEGQLDAIYFNSFTFAGAAISFATKVTLLRDPANSANYRSQHFELIDIRAGVVDLQAYGAEWAELSDIKIVIDPRSIVRELRNTEDV